MLFSKKEHTQRKVAERKIHRYIFNKNAKFEAEAND